MLFRRYLVVSRVLLLLTSAALLAVAPSARAGRGSPGAPTPQRARSIVARSAGGVGPAAATLAVSAGGSHTCGLKGDGHILCWGNDSSLQVSQAPPTTFTQISAGDSHTCGLKDDGTAMCWGQNTNGQSTPPTDMLKLISAGFEHTCGIKTNDTVLCWGNGADGRTAQQAGAFINVSAGGLHSCGVKSDGTAHCWGKNDMGQTTVLTGTFTQVSAGGLHTCGLRSNGTVECWGRGDEGQTTVSNNTSYTQISAGAFHTCGRKTNGTIVCWGNNSNMQSIAPDGTFTQVSAGGYHSCAVDTAGGFRCWGRNTNRQAESRYKPQIITQPSAPPPLTAGDPLTLQIVASGAPTPTLQWRKNSVPLPNRTSATLYIAQVTLDDAGSYDVVVSNSMGSSTSNAVNVTVARLTQTISFDQPVDKRYGDPPFTLSASASSGLPLTFSVIAGTASINGSEMTITAAGVVVVRASQTGNGTYNPATSVEVSIDIARAPLKIQANDVARFFGEPNPPLTASYIGLVNGDTEADIDTKPSLTTLAGSGSPLGDYPIFASGAADANYTITTANGTLRIVARLFYLPMVMREAPFGQE
jgi:hypothetical protein